MDSEAVQQQVRDDDIRFINLQFTDILGTVKNVEITASQLEEAFDRGVWFDGSSIDGFARIQESDMRLVPDPDTFTTLPWKSGDRRTARMICDVHEQDGTPFDGGPRQVLKAAIADAREDGYRMMAGPEPEFFVFDPDEGDLAPHDQAGYFDLAPRDLADDLRQQMILHLEQMGFDIEASHHEVADGQHEIDFEYGPALETADRIGTFRSVVRTHAAMQDLEATFMPKPIEGINGSGMHVHISLFDEDSTNVFAGSGEFGLSSTGKAFLAGVLEHAGALTAVCNPTVNSYKRLVPGYEAPVYQAWSAVNRSALIRIPQADRSEAARIELRSPDPTANPYLALAAILRAGMHGIRESMEPPEPVRENIYEFDEQDRAEHGIETLPETLSQALDALEDDPVVRDALGDHVAEKFLTAKRQEVQDYRTTVTDWEHERYRDRS